MFDHHIGANGKCRILWTDITLGNILNRKMFRVIRICAMNYIHAGCCLMVENDAQNIIISIRFVQQSSRWPAKSSISRHRTYRQNLQIERSDMQQLRFRIHSAYRGVSRRKTLHI